MEVRANLRGIFLTVVLCALALVLSTCGGRKSAMNPPSIGSGGQPQHGVAPRPGGVISLDEALAELGGMETPEGVDEALWAELKDALGKALQETGSGELQFATPSGVSRPGGRESNRVVSTPPTGESNRVTDLAITDNGDGTFTLSWHYRNLGDYDQDSAVGIEDVTPLAMHYSETYELIDENCLLAVIDGSGNGRIGIEDITPIAMNFGANVHHYSIQGSHFFSGSFTETAQLVFPEDAPNDARLVFEHSIGEEPEYLYWRIVPIDDEGNPGDTSNTAEVSAAPPPPVRILSVNPLGGVTGTEVTFSAVISGEAPFDYEWDFGGGATPNETTEASPTVTLGAVDAYDAQLSVENAEGSAVKHFTLTVTAEPGEPPEIISVSPTEGDSGTEATFTAEVTGDGTFTYYWDFGGGASPNQSSGVSGQPSATVTLSRGGTLPEPVVTYPASLTVTNPYGMTTHDFNLNISAWWHVEKLPPSPSPYPYMAGVTSTFAPDGELYGWTYVEDGTAIVRLANNEWQSVAVLEYEYSYQPSLEFDSVGTISMVGLSSGYPGSSVWFSQYKGDTWTHEYVATDFWPRYLELVFDSRDRPVIAYSSLVGGGSQARKTVVASKAGSEWEIIVVSEQDEDRITGFYSLATGSDNRWILGYGVYPRNSGDPPSELLLLRESESGFARETVMENASGQALALTPDGKALILFGSEGWLRVARETEGDWAFEQVVIHASGTKNIAVGPDGVEIVTFAVDGGEEGWQDDEGYWALYQDGEWNLNPLPFPYRVGLYVTFHPDGCPALVTLAFSAGWNPGGHMAMYW